MGLSSPPCTAPTAEYICQFSAFSRLGFPSYQRRVYIPDEPAHFFMTFLEDAISRTASSTYVAAMLSISILGNPRQPSRPYTIAPYARFSEETMPNPHLDIGHLGRSSHFTWNAPHHVNSMCDTARTYSTMFTVASNSSLLRFQSSPHSSISGISCFILQWQD